MKDNFTAITVLLDASGSMDNLRTDTIGSFNSFIEEQKLVPGEAAFTLCSFNDKYHLIHDFIKLSDLPNLTAEAYRPSGGTALLDAMGKTINNLGNRLSALSEDERPSKVIMLIITDGQENQSKKFTAAQIKNMVQHQQEVYSWNFVFLGAGIDVITEGDKIGISAGHTMSYQASSAGTSKLYANVGQNMTRFRTSALPNPDFFVPNQVSGMGVNNDPVAMPSIKTPTAILPTSKKIKQVARKASKSSSKKSIKKI